MSWEWNSESPDASGSGLDKWHRFRGAVLLCVLLLGFVGLAIRCFYIQVLQHDDFVRMANSQQIMERPIPSRRGGFFDCMGRPLCVSVPVKSIFAVPCQIEPKDVQLVSFALSKVLGVDQTELHNGLLKRYDKQFMWVKRLVTEDEAAQVAKLKFKGIGFVSEFRRTFPQGLLAPHVIGFTDRDQLGQEGLEAVLNSQLAGEDGYERLDCDGKRQPILTDRAMFKPVRHGNDVRLTIDAEIQRTVSNELDEIVKVRNPVAVVCIVIETKTGRILALDNRPTFSPVAPADVKDPTQRLNRAVSACYEPGSIFKPFVMSGYLEGNLGTPETRFFCENGSFHYRGRTLHDAHPKGWLTATRVIAESSNIGMAKVGLEMGADRIYASIKGFGFGKSTGCGLPGEIGGLVTPWGNWTYYTVTSVPMGQEIAATPMQLAAAFNAIANGGVYVKPRIIDGITDPDGKVLYQYVGPDQPRRVISEATAKTLIDPMLHEVVLSGTATSAHFGDYEKFGKTGTAQKKSTDGNTFSHSKFVSSFLCGAPLDDPKLTVLVLIDEPRAGNAYYGGTVSAPPAARIIEKSLKYLGVPTTAVASKGGI